MRRRGAIACERDVADRIHPRLTLRAGSLSREQALALDAQSVTLPSLFARRGTPSFWSSLDVFAAEAVAALGRPAAVVRDLEGSPGLWVLDHEPTGVVFLVWSDGHNKKPFRGTSYGAIAPGELESRVPHAYADLEQLILEGLHQAEDSTPTQANQQRNRS